MSVRAISAVWDHSRQTGNGLLLMLALADVANDAFEVVYENPQVKDLATKTRTSVATIKRCITAAERSGELLVERARGKSNRYRLVLSGAQNELRPGLKLSPEEAHSYEPRGSSLLSSYKEDVKDVKDYPTTNVVGDGSKTQAHVVAKAYVDAARQLGYDPAKSLIARIAAEAKKLLTEGKPVADVVRAAERIAKGRKSPAMLALALADVESGGHKGANDNAAGIPVAEYYEGWDGQGGGVIHE